MRKRWLPYLAAFAALSLGVAACGDGGGGEGGDGGDGEEITLTWAIGGAEAQQGGVHQDVAAKYSEETDGVTVEIDELPDEADEQREQQSLELDAGGDQFDILGVDIIWTGEYTENGWIESLEDIRDEIESVSIPGAVESAIWDGELWAAPYNTNAGFLFYRTDLIDEPPTTWDELAEVGLEAAEEAGIDVYAAQGAQYEGFVVNWLELYWSADGDLYNEDQSEVTFDEATATEVTEWLAQAQEDGVLAPGFNNMAEEEARNHFQSGEAVFMRNWPYAYELGESEDSEIAGNFDIAPLPTFTGDGTISALGGFNNAVSAFSNHTEEAMAFVEWAATNEEVQTMLAEEASVPPTMESVYDDLQDDPVMALLGEVLPDARARPPAPDWNSISVEIQQNMFPAYNGERDAAEASANVAEFLEGTIQ